MSVGASVAPTDTQIFDPGGDIKRTLSSTQSPTLTDLEDAESSWQLEGDGSVERRAQPSEPEPPLPQPQDRGQQRTESDSSPTERTTLALPLYAIRDKRRKIEHGLFEARKTIAMVPASFGLEGDECLKTALCVDTCAGTAGGILSAKLVNRLPPKLRSRYRPGSDWSQRTLLEAYDGHAHASPDGHIDLETTVGSCTETIRYLVCSAMAQDAILGVGGIKEMGLVVDLPNSRVLTADNKHVPLISEESIFLLSKSRVSDVDACLCEDVIIPARSKRLVKVRVHESSHYARTTWTAAVVEDDQTAIEHQDVAAHGIVEIIEGKATILMSNLGNEPILLPQGRTVAVFKPRTRVEINAIREPNRKSRAHAQQKELSPDELAKHKKDVMEALEIERLGLDEIERAAVEFMVERNIMQFASEHNPLTRTKSVKHHIETGDAPPQREPPRTLGPQKLEVVKEKLSKMRKEGTIRPSKSPWAAAIVLAPKKQQGQWRFAVDYRKLNDVTKFDAYPMPRADVGLDCLKGANWFTTIDLASGFHQVEISEEDKEKTAFVTPYGLYEFVGMPFGLKCAPATFQRLMDIVLAGLCWKSCLVYLDDVLVFTRGTIDEHVHDVSEILNRLKDHGLKANPGKCRMAQKELVYLGHVVSEKGCSPDPRLVKAVVEYPQPKNQRTVRGFLGLAGYYRRYIENFAEIAAPLTSLLKRDSVFAWGEEQEQAFKTLKSKLSSRPVLAYPDFDLRFRVKTDWSQLAQWARS